MPHPHARAVNVILLHTASDRTQIAGLTYSCEFYPLLYCNEIRKSTVSRYSDATQTEMNSCLHAILSIKFIQIITLLLTFFLYNYFRKYCDI